MAVNNLDKIKNYCAYQERSVLEVKQKLVQLGIQGKEQEDYLKILIAEGYVHDRRFANQFAGSKFRIKLWGKEKISQQLVQKGLDEAIISAALDEIPEYEYAVNAQKLMTKYLEAHPQLEPSDPAVYKFLRQKGYEHELVLEVQNL